MPTFLFLPVRQQVARLIVELDSDQPFPIAVLSSLFEDSAEEAAEFELTIETLQETNAATIEGVTFDTLEDEEPDYSRATIAISREQSAALLSSLSLSSITDAVSEGSSYLQVPETAREMLISRITKVINDDSLERELLVLCVPHLLLLLGVDVYDAKEMGPPRSLGIALPTLWRLSGRNLADPEQLREIAELTAHYLTYFEATSCDGHLCTDSSTCTRRDNRDCAYDMKVLSARERAITVLAAALQDVVARETPAPRRSDAVPAVEETKAKPWAFPGHAIRPWLLPTLFGIVFGACSYLIASHVVPLPIALAYAVGITTTWLPSYPNMSRRSALWAFGASLSHGAAVVLSLLTSQLVTAPWLWLDVLLVMSFAVPTPIILYLFVWEHFHPKPGVVRPVNAS